MSTDIEELKELKELKVLILINHIKLEENRKIIECGHNYILELDKLNLKNKSTVSVVEILTNDCINHLSDIKTNKELISKYNRLNETIKNKNNKIS